MKFTLKLIDSDKAIRNKILDAMLPEIKNFMTSGVRKIKSELPPILQTAIRNTPEYESLISGKLQYEFGIPDAGPKIANLINIWTTNIDGTFYPPTIASNKIKSSFSIYMIRSDFSDVLNTDSAMMTDNTRGYSLPWLEWLLLEGNKTIIKNYEIAYGPNQFSRTGFAVMRPARASWKVPSEFSGTISDNWITRAIDRSELDIQKLLDGIFQ